MTGRRNEEPIELMHEDFQVHVDSDWVGDLLGRRNTTGVVVRRCIEECVSMTSENKITTYTRGLRGMYVDGVSFLSEELQE